MSTSEVLESEIKPNALLEELLHNTKPVNWEALEQYIPDWTAEERAQNEAQMLEAELERPERIKRQLERDAALGFLE
jgi:hypothetical protein